MTTGQHRLWHGVILKEFLEEVGVEPTKENIEFVKEMFKEYLEVASVGNLDSRSYTNLIQASCMLMAREMGVEVPRFLARKTMRELLEQTNQDYDTDNGT